MTYKRLWFSLYGSRSVRLQDLNFEDEQLKVVHRNGKKAFMCRDPSGAEKH
jgi:hypothetical protein